MTGTYRAGCPVDGCDTRFIAISKNEYVEHLHEEHSVLKASIVDEMVVDDSPDCADAKLPESDSIAPAQSDVSRGECLSMRLQARGRTDAEIGSALGYSMETVTRHVRGECEHGIPDGRSDRNR
jgi:DNA-binding NarL/FixJ family response regulator